MHERQRLALELDGILDRGTDQTLGAWTADRLDTQAYRGRLLFAEADLLKLFREVGLNEIQRLQGDFRPRLEIDTRVNIFRVFAENHHVDL